MKSGVRSLGCGLPSEITVGPLLEASSWTYSLKNKSFGLLVANSLSIRFEINSSVEFLVRITVLVQHDRTALPAFYRICVCMVVAIFLSSLTPSPTPHLHLFFFSVFQEKKEAKSTEWPFFEFGIIQMSSF